MVNADNHPFQDVGRIFPDETDVVSVESGTTVREALEIMLANRYSQLPVVSGERVRGVFSLWSLAGSLVELEKFSTKDLVVEDVMERLPTVSVRDSLEDVLGHLSKHDAVLVLSPRGLQAVATATDVLDYFYGLARPYLLLQEIELSLRSLISACLTPEELNECIDRALRKSAEIQGRRVPSSLNELSFEDYRTLIGARANWPLFEGTLGRSRELVTSKLARVRDIRNSVFHFKGPISVIDHETLAGARNWLLDKTRTANEAEDE